MLLELVQLPHASVPLETRLTRNVGTKADVGHDVIQRHVVIVATVDRVDLVAVEPLPSLSLILDVTDAGPEAGEDDVLQLAPTSVLLILRQTLFLDGCVLDLSVIEVQGRDFAPSWLAT